MGARNACSAMNHAPPRGRGPRHPRGLLDRDIVGETRGRSLPAFLTDSLLRTTMCTHLLVFRRGAVLNRALLCLRASPRRKTSICIHLTALATRPGGKCGPGVARRPRVLGKVELLTTVAVGRVVGGALLRRCRCRCELAQVAEQVISGERFPQEAFGTERDTLLDRLLGSQRADDHHERT